MHIHRLFPESACRPDKKHAYIKLYIKKKRKEYGAPPRNPARGKRPWTGLQNYVLFCSLWDGAHKKRAG